MERTVCIYLLCLLLVAPTLLEAWGSDDKVLLEKVTAITLEKGKMTTGRRVSPIPQLTCVGGSTSCYGYQPSVVQCTNSGLDDHNNVQWECKAEMDNEYRFGRIEVVCEGYDYPDDPYILKGSCGLKYELDLTGSTSQKTMTFTEVVVVLIIIGIVVCCIIQACRSSARTRHTSSYGGGGYYVGHGGGGGWRSSSSSSSGSRTTSGFGGTSRR